MLRGLHHLLHFLQIRYDTHARRGGRVAHGKGQAQAHVGGGARLLVDEAQLRRALG
jgi:hypothetical protein